MGVEIMVDPDGCSCGQTGCSKPAVLSVELDRTECGLCEEHLELFLTEIKMACEANDVSFKRLTRD